MKKTFLRYAVVAFVTGSLVLTGCEKLTEDATQTATSGEDAAEDLSYMNAMVDMVEDVMSSEDFMLKKGKKKIKPDNVPINYVDTSFTDGDGTEIKINFGKVPVLCLDGFKRSGILIIRANKPYNEVGCVIEAYTDGSMDIYKGNDVVGFYAEEGVDVGGGLEHITITRVAADKIELDYTIEVYVEIADPGNYDRTDGIHYPASGKFTVTQIGGFDDDGVLGNEYSISGGGKGENHDGTKYDITITEDLYRKIDPDCSKTMTKGKMTLKNEGATTDLKIDFGDGTCDNKITIILPGNIKKDYTLK